MAILSLAGRDASTSVLCIWPNHRRCLYVPPPVSVVKVAIRMWSSPECTSHALWTLISRNNVEEQGKCLRSLEHQSNLPAKLPFHLCVCQCLLLSWYHIHDCNRMPHLSSIYTGQWLEVKLLIDYSGKNIQALGRAS